MKKFRTDFGAKRLRKYLSEDTIGDLGIAAMSAGAWFLVYYAMMNVAPISALSALGIGALIFAVSFGIQRLMTASPRALFVLILLVFAVFLAIQHGLLRFVH